MSSDRPIGIFDSGVGGLSVMRVVRQLLPHEDLYYVADSANAPYGIRDAEFIAERADRIMDFFIERDIKALVVACNTASGVAVKRLRGVHRLPIIAMEPAIKPASLTTRSGVIGVLATNITVASAAVSRLVEAFAQGVEVLLQPCPGLVECVERADTNSPQVCDLLESYIHPLLRQGADTLVLGCTHYPFLLETIRRVAGSEVKVIDPAPAVAAELKRRLSLQDALSARDSRRGERYWTSGDTALAQAVFSKLLGQEVEVQGFEQP